jgi:hypothetical protein
MARRRTVRSDRVTSTQTNRVVPNPPTTASSSSQSPKGKRHTLEDVVAGRDEHRKGIGLRLHSQSAISSVIDVSPVTEPDDHHGEDSVVDGVDDAVVPDADA